MERFVSGIVRVGERILRLRYALLRMTVGENGFLGALRLLGMTEEENTANHFALWGWPVKKFLDFLKAFAAFAVILVFLFLLLVSVIAELFPAVIPDWMYTVLAIAGIPLGIVFFVVVLKEWLCQRKEKKAANKNKRPQVQKPSND